MAFSARPSLWWALLVSLILHALLFALRGPQYETPLPTPQLEARIVEAPPAVATVQPKPSPPSPAPEAAKKKPAKRVEAVHAEKQTIPPPQQQPNTESIPEPSVSTDMAENSAPSVVAPQAAPVIAPSAPPVAAVADPGAIARYRITLMGVAERYKRFPEYARDREWQGRADWIIEIAADGRLSDLRLKKSSGYEVLDRAAGEMLRKAQPETPLPSELQGRSFSFGVGVVFNFSER